jgi:hypothetical protein
MSVVQNWTVTAVREGKTTPNPKASGNLTAYYVDLVGEDGQESKDTYWRRKEGNAPNVNESYYLEVKEGDFGPRAFSAKQNSGPQRLSTGAGRGPGPQPDAEFWAAKDARIARAGMLQAVVASGMFATNPNSDGFVYKCNDLVDKLLASLDERVPHPNASPTQTPNGTDTRAGERTTGAQRSSPAPAASPAQSSMTENQNRYFERLLGAANFGDDARAVRAWAHEVHGTVDVIGRLKDGDAEGIRRDALAWAAQQSDVPGDDSDLPTVDQALAEDADGFISDDQAVPF